MGEAFIVRRGGGGTGKLFAAIGVTYPAGSVCTCTMGSKTLTAKDTSGQALFAIPSAGDWTVKAVSGTQTASAVISVTEDGPRAYYISLAYQLMPTDFDLAAYGTKGVDYEVVQDDDTVIPEADYGKYLNWKIRLLSSGTLLKLRFVYDLFVTKFPWIAKVLTFDKFSALVDDALDEMRNLLEKSPGLIEAVETGK